MPAAVAAGRLAGKAAVVVGAGQTPGETLGNGRAIALLFAREGARVLCVDRVAERAAATVAMIREEGGEAHAFTADITRAAEAEALVAEALARFGALDVLVNNVGIGGGGDGPIHKLEEDAFDRTMAVNLKGMVLVTRAALGPMRAAGRGAIVNISSLASIAGAIQVAYEMSKAAVNRLTISTAQAQARHGVRCNAILPGLMDTPMAVVGISSRRGQSMDEVRAERNARVPLGGRMGTAWDTAHAALFLASDEAKFITGVLLPVDGGMGTRVG
jgi:NAD(P)-dependent dehydrogenase (short-subunit alcohol dehydrogenase family)